MLRAAICLVAIAAAAPANAATVFETAAYTGQDTGEYIVARHSLLGAAFTLTQTTQITGIGGQFGGFPGGTIFGTIRPVGVPDLVFLR